MAEPPVASDEAALAAYGIELVEAVEAAIGPWIRGAVLSHCPQPWPELVESEVERAAGQAGPEIGDRLRDLLALDIDQQWTNPLSIIRSAVRYPTAILTAIGIPPVDRDSALMALYPEDVYDLSPTSFADLGPGVQEQGLVWGAAKAHVHLRRHKSEELTP